jgi:hypothetical protein
MGDEPKAPQPDSKPAPPPPPPPDPPPPQLITEGGGRPDETKGERIIKD